MQIMVVGGGGREHAIVLSLLKNKQIKTIYALPGNGGIADVATCVPIKPTDITGLVDFAKAHAVDFAIVAPDDPLVLGAVDALEDAGIPAFGPNKAAAIIEGSKAFAKSLMEKYDIPTAQYRIFTDENAALSYIDGLADFPVVIKADGLALGKGVIIAPSRAQAKEAVQAMMSGGAFGESGKTVVIEEFLTGPEVSVLAFTDGHTLVPMVSSMDHKRALDGDAGLNTGGMGAIAPNPYYTEEIAALCMERIFLPTMHAMNAEKRTFRGCLYFGLMLTPKGPKVIEYNCRFGDPETQVVLPLLQSDLYTILRAVRDGKLAGADVSFSTGSACCVVLASGGYPEKYETNKAVLIDKTATKDAYLYHAGTRKVDGVYYTSGGRVLGVSATAGTLKEAVRKAYAATNGIAFENMHLRQDIGQRALLVTEE